MRAERKAGQMLKQMEELGVRKGRGGSGANQHQQKSHAVTIAPSLADLGITKTQSSQWQKLGAMSQRDFNLAIGESVKSSRWGLLGQANVETSLRPIAVKGA